jgi:hypothetical protein
MDALQELNALRADVYRDRAIAYNYELTHAVIAYNVVIKLIDRRMEELDRVGCESSDQIDEGLLA